MTRIANLSLANLTALMTCIALVMAPHAQYVPKWAMAFCFVALLLRLLIGWQGRRLPSRWLMLVMVVVAIAGVLYSYRSLFSRDSAITLLLAMTALKSLEMRARRDISVIIVLCYFLAITNFLYTQTMLTALYSFGAVWMITGTMVSFEHYVGPARLRQVVRTSGVLLAQAIPVMLVLFVLFPRVEGPLWGLPRIESSGRTGLSDKMSPGSMSRLSLSDEIAFRANFENIPSNTNSLYWRGPVLWDFDGRTWRSGDRIALSSLQFERLGPLLNYTVTLEPHDQRWLYMIDMPTTLPDGGMLTRDYQAVSIKPIRSRLLYEAQSSPLYRVGADALPAELRRALVLPQFSAPQTREMVREWQLEGMAPRQIAERALRMFRELPFIYTLEPPLLTRDSVDQFLFETRRGFCEHYASSFTVMMRAAGVPARVVTGYLGGEVNPVDGYLVVRQSEAHAWAEIWLAGEGWVRVDPTAAVSPLRIENGIADAVAATAGEPLLRRTNLDWIRELRYQWDAVTNSWNQWVLGYSPDRQNRFLSTFGFTNVGWRDLVFALMIVTAIIIGVFAVAMFLHLHARSVDPIQKAWLRFCKKMANRGLARKPSEGPWDFTERVASEQPNIREGVQRIRDLYIDLRYGEPENATGNEALRELREHIKKLDHRDHRAKTPA